MDLDSEPAEVQGSPNECLGRLIWLFLRGWAKRESGRTNRFLMGRAIGVLWVCSATHQVVGGGRGRPSSRNFMGLWQPGQPGAAPGSGGLDVLLFW